MARPTQSESIDLGNLTGQMRSTSENLQKVICLVAMACGVGAGFFQQGNHGFVVILIGTTIFLCVSLYLVAKHSPAFSDRLELFEQGAVLTLRGKKHRFAFSQVETFRSEQTHHVINGNYAGTRVGIELCIEGRLRPIRCDLECHQKKQSGEVIEQFREKIILAIRNRMAEKLEREGEIHWTPNVALTLDGLRVHDGMDEGRMIPIEQIHRWDFANNEIRFWKRDEGMPFLTMSVDVPNFAPIHELFGSLHQCYCQQDAEQTLSTEEQFV